jgi:hypothetical protein
VRAEKAEEQMHNSQQIALSAASYLLRVSVAVKTKNVRTPETGSAAR